MIKAEFSGRLGNTLFQNIGISILAKKFNYKTDITYNHYTLTDYDKKVLGIKLNNGELINLNFKDINDDNVLDVLKLDNIDYGLNYKGFFELKDFVINYKEDILNHFDLEYDNINKNDVFIHVRLGDIAYEYKLTAELDYYIKSLDSIKFQKGYISSDSLNHPYITFLVKKYNLTIVNNTPVETINFGKNFNNLVLSQGTFSWWIGFLSKANNIYYPNNYKRWHGDIFVFENWKGI